MQLENPITFLRSIRGAPACVLWALVLRRRPMTNQELQRWTGYGHDSVTPALRLLVDLGWVSAASSRGPWRLAAGRQVPLMPMQAASEPDEDSEGGSAALALSSSCSSNIEGERDIEQEEQGNAGFPHSPQRTPVTSEVHRALLQSGIREPKASALARLDHVTPDYVRAHVRKAREQGHALGTAIHRIQNAWPLERNSTDAHDEDCQCLVCRLRRSSRERWEEEDE